VAWGYIDLNQDILSEGMRGLGLRGDTGGGGGQAGRAVRVGDASGGRTVLTTASPKLRDTLRVRLNMSTCMYTCIYICVCMSVCVRVYINTYMSIFLSIYLQKCMYRYIYIERRSGGADDCFAKTTRHATGKYISIHVCIHVNISVCV